MNTSYQKDYWLNFAKNENQDSLASDLHDSWDKETKSYTEHTEIPQEWLESIKKEEVLDLGIGFGRNSLYLQSKFRNVYGYDTEEMLSRSKNFLPDGILSSSDWLDYDKRQFDLVYQSIAMQHIPPQEVLYYLMSIAQMSPYFFSYTRCYNDYLRDFQNRIGGINMALLVESTQMFDIVECEIPLDEAKTKMDETHYKALYKSRLFS